MTIPEPLPAAGLPIPVRASFTVVKRIPWLAITSNNLAPRLIMFEDGLESRVIITRRHDYCDIEQIDARQTFAAQSIIFHWHDGLFAFSANIGEAATLGALLVFFAGRQIPLSERARRLMRVV